MKKDRTPNNLRYKVLKRDGYRCRYCGRRDLFLEVDHVYPQSAGGITDISNLVTACRLCNSRKGSSIGIWPKPIGYFDSVDEGFSSKNAMVGSAFVSLFVGTSLILLFMYKLSDVILVVIGILFVLYGFSVLMKGIIR